MGIRPPCHWTACVRVMASHHSRLSGCNRRRSIVLVTSSRQREGVNGPTRGAREEGAVFFECLTVDSWSSRWNSRWDSETALRVTASLLFQEIKPLLSKNLPDGSPHHPKKKPLQGISLIHCVNICKHPSSSWVNAANGPTTMRHVRSIDRVRIGFCL